MKLKYHVGQTVWVVSYDIYDSPGLLQQLLVDRKRLRGEVVKLGDSDRWITVKFEEYMGGHDGGGISTRGHCWGMTPEHIIPWLNSVNYGKEGDA